YIIASPPYQSARPPEVRDAYVIATAGMAALDGGERVRMALQDPDLAARIASARRLHAVAVGKVAEPMLRAAMEALPKAPWAGSVLVSGSTSEAAAALTVNVH